MKDVESQWKPLEQELSEVREGKKWLSRSDKTNRFADDNISMGPCHLSIYPH
jgi:hypothetical protein